MIPLFSGPAVEASLQALARTYLHEDIFLDIQAEMQGSALTGLLIQEKCHALHLTDVEAFVFPGRMCESAQ